MKNNISIFAILLSVLTTMPFSVFADLPEGAYLDEWMKDEFCADDSTSFGMNCAETPVFSCQKYIDNYNSDLFVNLNRHLKKACKESKTTLFSNIEFISVKSDDTAVASVRCKKGYIHPISGTDRLLRCEKESNFSQEENDACENKGCEYKPSGTRTIKFGGNSFTERVYKCICADDATQSNTTPTPAPKPAPSKAGGAGQKRVATPPVKKDARTLANEQYAEDMRKPWQEYTAEGGDDELEAQEMTLPPEANTTAYAVADDEVEAQEMTLPPEANTQSRDAANAQYADDMRQPWQEYEAQEMTLPAEANTDATAVTPATEKTKKGICTNVKAHQLMAKYVGGVCTVESCVVGYELVDNACVKKEKPAKTETEPTEKTKKGICTNVKAHQLMAKYVDGVCTVESCVVGYEVVDNACVKKTKPTNDAETEPTEKTKKGICTNVKAHQLMAKYVDGVCTVESCVVGYEVVDNACVKKTKPTNESEEQETEETTDKTKKGICTNIKEHHLLAKYVDGVCTVESCVVGYEVSEDKKSCVAKDKSAKVAEKEQKKLEKELETDMNVLHTEFMAVVKKLMRDCKSKSGTINSETYECEIAATPGAE